MEILTVAPGDTIFSIAAQYGLEPQKIIADNGLNSDGLLVVGQSLVLLFPELVHIASAGETVEAVAAQYGISTRTLLRNNYFLGGNADIPAGSRVVIRYEEAPQTEKFIGGYAYDFIDSNLLRAVISYMTYLMPFTYGFTPQGTLVSPADERLIGIASDYGAKPLMHLSTLTEGGYFSNELAHEVLNDPAAVERLTENVLANIREKGYYGVDVDFEFLYAEDKEAYVAFIAGLAAALRPYGYLTVVALPPKTSDDQPGQLYEGIDYAALGAAADYGFLMTYEWGYRYGPPMAVAPIDAVRRVVEYALTRVPVEKLILGISNYGYDWTLPYVRGESVAPSLSTVEALEIALTRGADIRFDEQAQSPYFYYTDDGGNEHVVWFEDARSYAAKVALMEEYDLAGGFIWDLMRRNPQGYVTLNALLDIE